ncbi:RluA family pseudouridine synthase [Sphingoaurantiacus capsulatus]|uniref:Pseudouridine synthase n=1 Tax=Sphingoaurantiacus capsulatus TaxID=1771310 RepID=A0ABV7X9T9_9SPHN
MTDVRQFTVAADDDGIRLDRWFKRHLPDTSFNIVSRWARTGQLRIDGKRAQPGDRVATGQVLRVPPAETPAPTAAIMSAEVRPKRELSEDEIDFARSLVIHRDEHAIVINKPPGLATQGGTNTDTHVDGLLDALQFDARTRPKLVHRLDKDTSGVLLLARSARAAGFFSKAFSERTARKVYWALVTGVPSPEHGTIDAPLAKQPGTGGEKMYVDPKEGLPARTRYRTVDRAGNTGVWLEMQPMTGRTHQLRVHAAAIGHPIVGDAKYGGRDAFLTGGISRKMHLHARRLVIEHPDGGMLDIKAELPAHIAESFDTLAFDMTLGDALPIDPIKFSETPEGKAKAEAAAAKSRRKERKGERRTRTRG